MNTSKRTPHKYAGPNQRRYFDLTATMTWEEQVRRIECFPALLAALRAITDYVEANSKSGRLQYATPHLAVARAAIARVEQE